ncbi:MAG: hypothetical protein HYV29_00395 [Ignavibacteriales bacterium]|nr:hypothetical protein [Ignavibacteriales bacterium]
MSRAHFIPERIGRNTRQSFIVRNTGRSDARFSPEPCSKDGECRQRNSEPSSGKEIVILSFNKPGDYKTDKQLHHDKRNDADKNSIHTGT